MALVNRENGKAVSRILTLFDKLHVEGLRNHGENNFEDTLSEGFPEADPLATIERQESVRVSFLSLGSLREWMRRIETIGQEFSRSLPIVSISMQSENVHDK